MAINDDEKPSLLNRATTMLKAGATRRNVATAAQLGAGILPTYASLPAHITAGAVINDEDAKDTQQKIEEWAARYSTEDASTLLAESTLLSGALAYYNNSALGDTFRDGAVDVALGVGGSAVGNAVVPGIGGMAGGFAGQQVGGLVSPVIAPSTKQQSTAVIAVSDQLFDGYENGAIFANNGASGVDLITQLATLRTNPTQQQMANRTIEQRGSVDYIVEQEFAPLLGDDYVPGEGLAANYILRKLKTGEINPIQLVKDQGFMADYVKMPDANETSADIQNANAQGTENNINTASYDSNEDAALIPLRTPTNLKVTKKVPPRN